MYYLENFMVTITKTSGVLIFKSESTSTLKFRMKIE